MHMVQTFEPKTRSKMQITAPTLCKRRMILYKLLHLHVNCPSLRTKCTTEIRRQPIIITEFEDLFHFEGKESDGPNNKEFNVCFTCEQFPASNEVSLDDQQHCSRFNQNACGQMPNFKSVIQLAPMSITPATQPENIPTNNTHTQPDHASCAP